MVATSSTADLLARNQCLALAAPLALDSGQVLDGVEIAYETYGELGPARDNAILLFHALTGDQYEIGRAHV